MSFVGDMFGGGGGGDASDAAIEASEIQAESQREALDYLKETEALPRQFREGALTSLGGVYGLEGGEGSQEDLIARARRSPLYSAISGTRQAGEKAIMRNAAATGGLRSGNVQGAMYDYSQRLNERAILASYNDQLQGLQGMAGLPSNANNIAAATAGIGQTVGQGIVASAQAQQAGSQQGMGNMMGLANLGISAYGAGLFSDRRLKTRIVKTGTRNGFNWYTWVWNATAQKLGLAGKSEGVIADEVQQNHPHLVGSRDGFQTVDYEGIANV